MTEKKSRKGIYVYCPGCKAGRTRRSMTADGMNCEKCLEAKKPPIDTRYSIAHVMPCKIWQTGIFG